MMSQGALRQYLVTLAQSELSRVKVFESSTRFGFAGGEGKVAFAKVHLPVPLLASYAEVEVLDVEGAPWLVSLAQMRKMKASLNLVSMKVALWNGHKDVVPELETTEGGYAAVLMSRNGVGCEGENGNKGSYIRKIMEAVSGKEVAGATGVAGASSFRLGTGRCP